MKFARIAACIFLALLCAGCNARFPSSPPAQTGREPVRLIAPDGHSVTVLAELARTPAEQQLGLMGRTSLAKGSGMLFIFPESAVRSFWMKKTLIPLDIVFFDAAGNVVSQASMVPCPPESAICPTTPSEGPAQYALELPLGYLVAVGAEKGWRLQLGSWASSSRPHGITK